MEREKDGDAIPDPETLVDYVDLPACHRATTARREGRKAPKTEIELSPFALASSGSFRRVVFG